MPEGKHKKSSQRKGKKHERPLSLAPLTFNQAVDKLLAAKPKSDERKKKA